jgi:hypothetical protein
MEDIRTLRTRIGYKDNTSNEDRITSQEALLVHIDRTMSDLHTLLKVGRTNEIKKLAGLQMLSRLSEITRGQLKDLCNHGIGEVRDKAQHLREQGRRDPRNIWYTFP